jgi:hypothetical protein
MIDLMLYIIIPAVAILSIICCVLNKQRSNALAKRQDEYARRISDIKLSYKTTLDLFSMQRVIRPMHVNNLYEIINNYFIDQPITEENTKRMENLANRIAITISKEVNMTKNDADTEWLKKKLLNFAVMLPNSKRGFNKSFYQSRIKKLIHGLNTTRSTFVQRHTA